jgi:hypothetical protein
MSGVDDPGLAKTPDVEVKPPAEEIRPPDPEKVDMPQTETEAKQESNQEREGNSSQDSIVAATPQSQDEDEDVEMETTTAADDISQNDAAAQAKQGSPATAGHVAGPGQAAEVAAATPPPASSVKVIRDEHEDATPTVEPFDMFEAVVAEMKEAPDRQPRAAWTMTVAELYVVAHDQVQKDDDLVPVSKQHYPKLRGEEKRLLVQLFREICVQADGAYEEWERYAQAATQDLYNTKWSFTNIMNSMISKVPYARATPLNQWSTRGHRTATRR